MLFIQISLVITGYSATNASNSNFFGLLLVMEATNAESISLVLELLGRSNKCLSSNFFGGGAGSSATNANTSNFFGFQLVWVQCLHSSNFLGQNAGFKCNRC
jgi:hypothetical protein